MENFKKLRKTAIVGIVGTCLISLSGLVFVGWVIVKVMQHYGII